MFIIIMGVSGSGKTAVGSLLARELGWEFHDADDYHSRQNIAKMRAGIPLTDDDRRDWLRRLAELITEHLTRSTSAVLACSALKQRYRDILLVDPERVKFVYLKGSAALITRRMRNRAGHFMPPGLLESQLAILEEPGDALTLEIDLAPNELVNQIMQHYQLLPTTESNQAAGSKTSNKGSW